MAQLTETAREVELKLSSQQTKRNLRAERLEIYNEKTPQYVPLPSTNIENSKRWKTTRTLRIRETGTEEITKGNRIGWNCCCRYRDVVVDKERYIPPYIEKFLTYASSTNDVEVPNVGVIKNNYQKYKWHKEKRE